MNRREFLKCSTLVASAGLLPRFVGMADTPPRERPTVPVKTLAGPHRPTVTEFRPLRRGVGIFTGRGGTIGWLANKDVLAVVDTQFPDTAAICLAGLPEIGRRTIDVVLNTHHHPDHTSGNPVFRPAAKTIVAQANVPKLQYAAAERAGTLEKQVYADTTFTEVWRRELGDEIVTAQYFGPAHTNGDAAIQFEQANVVHMGDLMFNRIYPVIDRPAGARIRGWIARLEEVLKTYPADAIYVFGHGNPKFGVTGGFADLRVFRDYLTALLDYTQKKIAAGEPKDRIVALENFPGFDDFHAPLPNRLGGNLSVAYDELTDSSA